MEVDSAIEKVARLHQVGERLLTNLDYEHYDRWNDGSLRVLDFIFGTPSEPYMSFRFPGGGEAANSRESRVKNSINQKLKVLDFVRKDLADRELKPKFGWTRSQDEIEKELSGLESV